MHVLHRPNLPRAVTLATLAAVLAVGLSLILASAASDLRSSPSATPSSSFSALAAPHQAVVSVWNANPFSPLLRGSVTAPWTVNPPFLAG